MNLQNVTKKTVLQYLKRLYGCGIKWQPPVAVNVSKGNSALNSNTFIDFKTDEQAKLLKL